MFAKVCDAGHKVTCWEDGGEIEHLESGQKTRFDRIDDVYRMTVQYAINESPVAGQGM